MNENRDRGRSDRSTPAAAGVVREARAQDVPDVLDVINAANRATYRAIVPPDRYREPFLTVNDVEAETRRMVFYVHERDAAILGVVALERRPGGLGVVRRLYVRPDVQRRGIGTSLLTHAEAAAVRVGVRRIVVWTDSKATWAVSFYKRCGYREIEPGTVFGDPDIDARARQSLPALAVLWKPL